MIPAGRHLFLSNKAKIPQNNSAILNIAHIIKHATTLETNAELAALYVMASEAIYIGTNLEEMGNKQPPTTLQTDNEMEDALCS